MARKPRKPKEIKTLTHGEENRKNIPTAELQPVVADEKKSPVNLAYKRRNRDLDPQLVWRGKDEQDESDLVVQVPPLYIQEKVHPKALIDDLQQISKQHMRGDGERAPDLFSDFNGIPHGVDKTEFYEHDQNWSNRMILGDSLQVMTSLAEREGLRGKVQCIYIDPPYGIKFNSNFQWSTTGRGAKNESTNYITREPEQVKAFRDTWRDGIHSYLTYLRDRMVIARDLLSDSGSVFVQIGDENVHRVRAVMDEVWGEENFVSEIILKTTSGAGSSTGGTTTLAGVHAYIIWFAKEKSLLKYRQLYFDKSEMQSASLYNKVSLISGKTRGATKEEINEVSPLPDGASLFRPDNLTSQSSPESSTFEVQYNGLRIRPKKGGWKTSKIGMERLKLSSRVYLTNRNTLQYLRKYTDFDAAPINDIWTDVGTGSFTSEKIYVVQTNTKIISRCLLMATDPGDLVLDPTCGSGTTAYVAEQWGRRWITVDTSRVALALARTRIMGARYPYYLLADSPEGQAKEAEITGSPPSSQPIHGSVRQGFVYERMPHIMLKSISNNTEIDVIWDKWQEKLEPLREALNTGAGKSWEEWEIPHEPDGAWSDDTKTSHSEWWKARSFRQKEIDASIEAKADFEYLYDKPYEDKRIVRVAGPFTVESLSPHRTLDVDENDELIDNPGGGAKLLLWTILPRDDPRKSENLWSATGP